MYTQFLIASNAFSIHIEQQVFILQYLDDLVTMHAIVIIIVVCHYHQCDHSSFGKGILNVSSVQKTERIQG